MTILERVKLLVGADDTKDSLLELLIENAQSDFLQITNQTSIPDNVDNIIADMTVIKYNSIGVEGLSGTSFSGVSESFMTDYPSPLKSAICRYKKVKML